MHVSRWLIVLLLVSSFGRTAAAQELPELNAPVNDLANVIDPESQSAIDRMSRALKEKTGDVVVVVTVDTFEPYADVKEYAVKLFENHGKGIGEKGKDNGALILLAMKERKVWVEVGYGLEEFITDGFAGETSREVMAPQFRRGRFGDGLRAGTERIIGRIAQGRGVTLDGVRVPAASRSRGGGTPISFGVIVLIFFAILIISRIGGGPGRRRRRYWGGGPWSGWSSGVGPFGGGWGGGGFGGGGFGGGGGGFGGGFGGFGGGRSGGGGGGSSW